MRTAADGVPASEIARRTGIPRSTIQSRRRGDLSRSATEHNGRGCRSCGGPGHHFATLPVEYAYLLGAYLGDGCISAHRRGVYRLRLTLDAVYPGIIEECEAAIRRLMPGNRVGRVNRGGGFDNSRLEATSRSAAIRGPGHA